MLRLHEELESYLDGEGVATAEQVSLYLVFPMFCRTRIGLQDSLQTELPQNGDKVDLHTLKTSAFFKHPTVMKIDLMHDDVTRPSK